MTPAVTSIGLPTMLRQAAPKVVLATSRLVLRKMNRDDVVRISALNDLLQQKDVDVPALDKAALAELCASFEAEWRQHGIGHLAIVRREDDRIIGHIHLKWLSDCKTARTAELSYAIDAPYQSRGYATEAVDAVLGFAFDQAGLDYVIACIEPDNQASVRVAEKNGMAPVAEGRYRYRLMRRYLLPAMMWRFHQKQRRAAQAAGAPAQDSAATGAPAGA
jgi:[ribosomal protein S5]-alanine N-acetyltransferase